MRGALCIKCASNRDEIPPPSSENCPDGWADTEWYHVFRELYAWSYCVQRNASNTVLDMEAALAAPDPAAAAALEQLSAADAALAAAARSDEAADLFAKIKVLEDAYRAFGHASEVCRAASRTRLRAERRYGELLGETATPEEAAQQGGSGNALLPQEKMERQRARKVAAVPEDTFLAYLAHEDADRLTRAGLLRAARPTPSEASIAKPETPEFAGPTSGTRIVEGVRFPRDGIAGNVDVSEYNVRDLKRVARDLIRRATPIEATALHRLFVRYAEEAERKVAE